MPTNGNNFKDIYLSDKFLHDYANLYILKNKVQKFITLLLRIKILHKK